MKKWLFIIIAFIIGSLLSGITVYNLVKPDTNFSHKKSQRDRMKVTKKDFLKFNQKKIPNQYQLPRPEDFDDNSRAQLRQDLRKQMEDMRKQMREQMNKFWEEEREASDIIGSFFSGPGKRLRFRNTYKEFLEKKENKNEIIFEVDLKTVDENSLKIDISNGQLSVEGTNKFQQQDQRDSSFHSTTMYSSFSQNFPIPKNVDAGKAKIEKEDGKLKIIFPKI